MDGTVYKDGKLIPGVLDFVTWLKDEKKAFLFLTNSSCYSPRDLRYRLKRLGDEVSEHNFYTSALSTAHWLTMQKPNGTAYIM